MINLKQNKFIVFLLMFILLINYTSGLGISPARTNFDFESNSNLEGEFKLLNEDGNPIKITLYTEDLIGGAILNVIPSEVLFSNGQEEVSIKYNMILPENIPLPGEHDMKIIAREISSGSDVEGTFVGASVAVVHQVRVNVPYPGKYASAELLVTETGKMNQVDFIVALNNLGKNKIVDAKGIINVYSSINDQKIATIESRLFDVDIGEREEIPVSWNEGVEIGKYYAELSVLYGGETVMAKREFTVGKSLVDIISIYVREFSLGEIAKFNILVENEWPESIHDVYTNFVFSQMGKEVDSFKSATEDIPESSKKELTAYWDTEGIEEGEYDAKITLYYGEDRIEKNVKTKVTMNSIIFEGLTGAVVGSPDSLNGSFLVSVILIIGLTSGFWVLYFKMKKKKKALET
jgi:hypothetical protein